MKTTFVFAGLTAWMLCLAAAFAGEQKIPPDYSKHLKFLGNPNSSRWYGTNAVMRNSRFCMTLFPHRGRIYLSGGDWNGNTGSCPIFSIDPDTEMFTQEYSAGTESVTYFREGGDGRLYVPGMDLREGAETMGAYFRRDADGTWTNMMNCPIGNIREFQKHFADQGYFIHTWDLACWKKKVFVAGYGISCGDEGTNEMFKDASPSVTSCLTKVWMTTKNGRRFGTLVMRRFEAFLPFPDELFCYPLAYRYVTENESETKHVVEEWRFDEKKGVFKQGENTWDNLYPDDVPVPLFGNTARQGTIPQCVTKFKNRCLYLAGSEGQRQRPRGLYSAMNVNHTVRAVKVKLPEDEIPVNITVYENKIAAMTIRRLEDGKFVNSVWESADGVEFRQLFTFKFRQGFPAGAFCKVGKKWFFSVGVPISPAAEPAVEYNGDEGAVYRIKEPVD